MNTYRVRDDGLLDGKIEEISEYVKLNYPRVRSIRKLLDDNGGPDYEVFRKAFKAKLGISPMKYLRRVRAEQAKVLLKTTNWKHYAIAREIGYKNEVTFSRFFKKQAGMTPREYRSKF